VGWEFGGGSPVRFGKIYLFDQTLYVSELTRGVRQLDISNPSRPGDLGLVRIDGNHDIALRGTSDGKRILFADSYADLVVIDVTLPAAPQTVDRLTNIFGQSYAIRWGDDILFERPVFGYTSRRVGGFNGCAGCSETAVVNEPIPSAFDGRATLSSSTATGRGGSMARFAVVGDYLYCVDYNQLYVLEISDPTKPRFVSRVSIGWGIETIFPYNNYVFIGGQNGMFIYSISDPRNPKYVSTFTHVRACDPVVVEGSLAYVTLRGGTRCGTLVSALHIVDINDLMKPSLLVSYALPQPMGLDVKNKVAYVCDDSTGVFILDTTNPNSIRELARITDKKGYDTIVRDNLLIVVSEGFVSFYNVSQVDMPFLLGRFQVPA
jgi:hypothetical protein